ncbi:MAG TPA: HD domain-containing phosphohydrolase [Longimicrobiaceae bacterium]|nr:HD domain-containing phosphohydrolase [Longimicrobiaceae bacterium]
MPRNEEGRGWSLAGVAAASAGLVWVGWMVDAARRRESEKMLHRRTVELLLNVLTAGDPVTARHSRRVADLSYTLAQAAGMRGEELRTLRVAALLHDMGKIDDRFFHIVHSRRPLTNQQKAEIKHHPHESAHILEPLEAEHPGLMEVVSSHHECWDGSGYPHGMSETEIPLGARVIAMADAFDAMTQPRKYRDAMPVDRALAELHDGSGTQFDPDLVELAESTSVRAAWAAVVQRDLFAERCALEGVTEEQAEEVPAGSA